MTGPAPAVAAARSAVRGELTELPGGSLIMVGLSGGPDSLALAAATAFVAPRLSLRAGAVIVDHGLQAGSRAVAERAAVVARGLGLDPVEVSAVDVRPGAGPEAAARTARYAAFNHVGRELGVAALLLGHTQDDQAETVLLRLSRGSGTRSLSGIPPRRGIFRRPFLQLRRADTEAVCAELGLRPWRDPHNLDPRFSRVRARALVAELDRQLGPGVVAGLARSAQAARIDADALDELAQSVVQRWGGLSALVERGVEVELLAAESAAVSSRILRLLAVGAGCPAGALNREHLGRLSDLVVNWRGQGAVNLPGGVTGHRSCGRLLLCTPRT
ncbi:MAG: tRNA lysidine(34) synthetase TilS [Angustibacter sp.]